jgi:hypothetical protein
MKIFSIIVAIVISLTNLISQERKNIKYGDVKIKDFVKNYSIDTSSEAVVLSDKAEITFEGNPRGGIDFVFSRHRRVHILKSAGLSYASLLEYKYMAGIKDRINGIDAASYNVENGKVVKSEMKSNGIFETAINKYYSKVEFVVPNVKEGTIIEFRYKYLSVYKDELKPWYFQESIPILYNELTFTIPEFFSYTFHTQGYNALLSQTNTDIQSKLKYNDADETQAPDWVNLNFKANQSVYSMKDVPALKPEQYSTATKNFISKIEFQLSSVNSPLQYRKIVNTWSMLDEKYLSDNDYQSVLDSKNDRIKTTLTSLNLANLDINDKIKTIYKYVRDNYTVSESGYSPYMTQKISKIIESKTGSNSDINGVLIGLLKAEGIQADPIILSLRDRGQIQEIFPFVDRFNFMIAGVRENGKLFYLDASQKKLPFKLLPISHYNGYARLISTKGHLVNISPDSCLEREVVSVKLKEVEGELIGKFENKLGLQNSYMLRANQDLQKTVFNDVKTKMSSDIEIENEKADNLDKEDGSVLLSFDYKMQISEDSIMYISPFVFAKYSNNPFPNKERRLPIEFPFLDDYNYIFNLDVPKGFEVIELPKSQVFSLDENKSIQFEFNSSKSNSNILIRSRIKINKSLFLPNEYADIRELYNLVSKKFNEQIVLKRI